jgi:hypothetical protein
MTARPATNPSCRRPVPAGRKKVARLCGFRQLAKMRDGNRAPENRSVLERLTGISEKTIEF